MVFRGSEVPTESAMDGSREVFRVLSPVALPSQRVDIIHATCAWDFSQTKVLEAEGQYIGKRLQDLGSKEVKGIGQPLDCFID